MSQYNASDSFERACSERKKDDRALAKQRTSQER